MYESSFTICSRFFFRISDGILHTELSGAEGRRSERILLEFGFFEFFRRVYA